MGIVFVVLALGLLGAAAVNWKDKGMRYFFVACCALNTWGAVDVFRAGTGFQLEKQHAEEAQAEHLRADRR